MFKLENKSSSSELDHFFSLKKTCFIKTQISSMYRYVGKNRFFFPVSAATTTSPPSLSPTLLLIIALVPNWSEVLNLSNGNVSCTGIGIPDTISHATGKVLLMKSSSRLLS